MKRSEAINKSKLGKRWNPVLSSSLKRYTLLKDEHKHLFAEEGPKRRNSIRISEYSNCCISLLMYLCTGLFALKDCVQDEMVGEVMSPYLASVAPLRSQQLGCYRQPVVRRGVVTTCIS